MKKINLSVNPTYLCNFRCSFCYLTAEQLADRKRLDLGILAERIEELKSASYAIDHVDLYGGEIALLAPEYLKQLDEMFFENGNPSINVVTNLSQIHPFFLLDHVELSVSFDFEARERHQQVLENIISLDKEVSILMLASSELLKMDVGNMIRVFNQIKNICSVEIKPYSTNQANQHAVSCRDYERFVLQWLENKTPKRFEFINEKQIERALKLKYNAFSDDHLYITPQGKFAVLDFDAQDNEFFLELSSLSDYEAWSIAEKEKIFANKFCSSCDHVGHCLTEHYRDVTSLEDSCNGFRGLLDHYAGRPPECRP